MRNIILILFNSISILCFAQNVDRVVDSTTSKSKINWANYYVVNKKYQKAVDFYSSLDLSLLNQDEIRAFANSLKKIGSHDKAVKVIETILKSDNALPSGFINFTTHSSSNKESQDKYLDLLSKYPNSKFISKLDSKYYNDSLYKLKKMSLNTKDSEFGAILKSKSKTLFFLGPQKRLFNKITSSNQVYNLYKANFDFDSLIVDNVKELDIRFNSIYQDGPIAFDSINNTIYLTRSSNRLDQNNRVQLDLFKLSIDQIEKAIPIPLSINIKGFSSMHPTVSSSGNKLYFSSDRPGGYGGMDLYYVKIINGEISNEIVNLGADINSSADESFPFIFDDKTLFYSTNQNSSKKFEIKMAINTILNRWEISELGYPFNSNGDDFSFNIDKSSMVGFLTSDRTGGKGEDDIYSFKFRPKIKGVNDKYEFYQNDTLVVGFNNLLKNDSLLMISEDPLTKIIPLKIKLIDRTSQGVLKLNENGSFWFKPKSNKMEKDSFSYKIITPYGNSDKVYVSLKVKKEKEVPKFNPIYFSFNESDIQARYITRLDSIANFLNKYPELSLEISSYTDCRGSNDYNHRLTLERNKSVLNFLKAKISSPDRLKSKNHNRILENKKFDYSIYIASFKVLKNAKSYFNEKLLTFPDISIEKSGAYYRIVLNKYEYFKEAKIILSDLKSKGYNGWISENPCNNLSEETHQSNRKSIFKFTESEN
jgi:hypothetical protein